VNILAHNCIIIKCKIWYTVYICQRE